MSVNVPAADLSAATTGTQGTLRWSLAIQTGAPVGVRAGRPTLRLFNESGCGLAYTIGASSGRLPAGGWLDMQLNGESSLDYTVEYVLSGQPVSLLLGTIYEAGERIPPLPQLGNSPIGIGGSVATSGAGGTDHILNSGNAPGTPTYTTTPSDQAGPSIADTNDGAGYRKILSAGVLRILWNVVRGNATTGKASVQLGDSGDASITTIYAQIGTGSAVPASTITGTLPAGQVGSGYPGGAITGAVASASNATTLNNALLAGDDGSNANLSPVNRNRGLILFGQDSGGVNHNGLGISASGGVVLFAAVNPQSGGSLSGINRISGSGSATVNHGLSATPDAALVNTANGSNSTTFGSGSYNSSTVFIYQFNPQPWVGLVYKA